MVRPVLKVAALTLLIAVMLAVHYSAKFVVHEGFGLLALVLIFLSLPWLSRYLDD